jgi:hypothetical protein
VRTARIVSLLLLLVLTSFCAYSQKPARNVNPHHHPNLAAAQKLSREAYERVTAAQKANEWDMGGHAAKAKDLLQQVNDELKAAAEEANEHH